MFLSKYGVARIIYIPIIKRAVVDFALNADWTPAAGDVKITKDGGAAANVTNLPTALTMGNTALWLFSLTATEMQAAQIVVTVADSATKAVEDQSFILETYGNASGQHEFDFDTATQNVNVSTITASAITAASIAADAITDAKVASDVTIASVTGAVGSVTGAVGSVTGAVGSVTGNVGGNVVGSVASVTAGVTLAASAVQAIWDALTSALTTVGSIGKLLVDNIDAAISSRLATASYTAPLDAAGTRTAVGLASANLDTQIATLATASALTVVDDFLDTEIAALTTAVADLPTNAELATALGTADDAVLAQVALVKAKTDLIPAAPAAVGDIPTANQNADALLDRAAGVETGLTVRQAFRLWASVLLGKLSGGGTATEVFRDTNDTKDRITVTVDVSGNRTAITRDAT